MTPILPHLKIPEKDRLGRIVRSRLRRYSCDNCGRTHIGFYTTSYYYSGGVESDFVWTDWEGNERYCENKHRRDPCQPKECHECWIKQIEQQRKETTSTH